MFPLLRNVPTSPETYLQVGTFQNELFYVTGPRCVNRFPSIICGAGSGFMVSFLEQKMVVCDENG